jgi:hypothetical protein
MNQRDNAIKRCIADFGPLTREQLIELAKKEGLGAAITLWRRLLPSKPLLSRKEIYVWCGSPNEKYVYADYDITKRKDLEHDLITTWAHITLHNNFDLLYWKRSKEKYKGKLNEDAYFILGLKLPQRTGEIHYYLESDTGSEGYAQIEDKLKRYLDHFEKEQKPFVVLFVCADERRATDLAKRAARTVSREKRKLYLFTSLESLRNNPRGKICRVPHDDASYTVLPALK